MKKLADFMEDAEEAETLRKLEEEERAGKKKKRRKGKNKKSQEVDNVPAATIETVTESQSPKKSSLTGSNVTSSVQDVQVDKKEEKEGKGGTCWWRQEGWASCAV